MRFRETLYGLITAAYIACGNVGEAQGSSEVRSKKISESLAKQLLLKQSGNINPKAVRLSNNQAFEVFTPDGEFFAISTTTSSTSDQYVASFTCSLMIFNKAGTLLKSITVVGASEERPWTCDSTKALSFDEWHPDGSLRIIAIYDATAPSSAQFEVPVVLKMKLKQNVLVIDENLTEVLNGGNASTIKDAKKTLKVKSARPEQKATPRDW